MALSYKESKKRKNSSYSNNTNTVSTLSDVQALDTNGSAWEVSDQYEWYEEYSDEHKSYVDALKNITVNDYQINIQQETNSQFIPFQMDRYYDGVDLMTKSIWIHYVTPAETEDAVKAVNVQYTDDTIEFAWLVTDTATALEGTLHFEICAAGENSKDEPYLLRTRVGTVNVLKPLTGNGTVAETSSLYDLLYQIYNRIGYEETNLSDLKKDVEANSTSIEELVQALSEITALSEEDINDVFDKIYG